MTETAASTEVIDPPLRSLDCFRSFQFITENPKWMMNVLFMAACQLIPLLGSIVVLGYQFKVAEALLHQSRLRSYPDFNFDRLLDYLRRGIWPFVAMSIVFVIMFVLMSAIAVPGILMFQAAEHAESEAAARYLTIGLGIIAVLDVALISVFNIVTIPMMLRAGYGNDLMKSLDLRFVVRFLRLTWNETLMSLMFLMACGLLLLIIGVAFCGVGVYFTMAILTLAQAHLMDFQLYSIYLSRGGEPIVRKRMV